MAADLIADDKGIAGTLPRRVLGRKKGRKHGKAAYRQSGGEIATTAELSSGTPLEPSSSAQSPELSSAEHMPDRTAAVSPAPGNTMYKSSVSSSVLERAKPSRDTGGEEEPQCSSPSDASQATSSQQQHVSDIPGTARLGDEIGAWSEVLGHTRRRQLQDQHVGEGVAIHMPLDREKRSSSISGNYGSGKGGNKKGFHAAKGDATTRLQGMSHVKHTDGVESVERPIDGSLNIGTRSGAEQGGAQGDASVRGHPTYSSALNSTLPASTRTHSGLRVPSQRPQVAGSTAQPPSTNIASNKSSSALPLTSNQSASFPNTSSRPESPDHFRNLVGEVASHGHHLTPHAGFPGSVGASESPSGAQELAWVEVRRQGLCPPLGRFDMSGFAGCRCRESIVCDCALSYNRIAPHSSVRILHYIVSQMA